MIKVVVSGASGRLGQRIIAHLHQAAGTEVVGALVSENSSWREKPVEKLLGAEAPEGLLFSANLPELLKEPAVLILATPAGPALAQVKVAQAAGCAVCVATTGIDGKGRKQLEQAAQTIPVLWAPNLSLGVTVLLSLVEKASKALKDYDLEILELHHKRKRDAPSGTAWALAERAAAARENDLEKNAILARAGEIGPRGQDEVGMQSIRGGDIIGEHTVYLVGETERVELTHRAANRDTFAAGAVHAARFLGHPERAAGLYGMADVLGLSEG